MLLIWEPRLLYEAPDDGEPGHQCASDIEPHWVTHHMITRRGTYRAAAVEDCGGCRSGEVFSGHVYLGRWPDPINPSDMIITSMAYSNPDLVWIESEARRRGAFANDTSRLPRPSAL